MIAPSVNTDRYDAIVIGAGTNGLTAATALGRAGRRVILLERRSLVGGIAAGEEFHPGYRSSGLLHDTTGLLPEVVDKLGLARHGLRRGALPPSVFAVGQSNGGLLLHHDPNEAVGELGDGGARDVESYADFRALLGRIKPFVRRILAEPPPNWFAPEWSDLTALLSKGLSLRRLGKRDMMQVLRFGPMCLADWLDERFDSSLLKCALAVPALHGYFGGPLSPGTCGAFFRYEALAGGAVVGGAAALVDSLSGAARACGVEILTDKSVSSITVSAGIVSGVVCEDGQSFDTGMVFSSCDPKHTLLELLGPRNLDTALERDINAHRVRGLTAKVNLAMNRPLRFRCRPDFSAEFVRTGQSLMDLERAFDAVKYGRFADAPVLDIHISSSSGSDAASGDHPVASILVHGVPYDLDGGWTDTKREELGDVVVRSLSSHVVDLDASIVAREVLTPVDIEQRYGVTGGHVYHGEHGLDQLLVRPVRQCARYATPIAGLYLCGSGSHPGGGITCAPGFLAANAAIAARNK